MRVLGIDPGSTITGYGIVEERRGTLCHIDNGGIRSRRGRALPERLSHIHSELALLIEKHRPEAVVIETLFFAKNVQSSLTLGQARGVAILAASEAGLTISEYSSTAVKQAITGNGRATKFQIQQMVKIMLKLPEIAMEDASDALAVAICHLHRSKLVQQLAAQGASI